MKERRRSREREKGRGREVGVRVLGGGGEVELRTTGNISASESALAPRHSPLQKSSVAATPHTYQDAGRRGRSRSVSE
jgi:hypothetical protein